jgi:hypothetical protein
VGGEEGHFLWSPAAFGADGEGEFSGVKNEMRGFFAPLRMTIFLIRDEVLQSGGEG